MKFLTIGALILISSLCTAQNTWKTEWLKTDKAAHFTVSVFSTAFCINISSDLKFKNPEIAGISAMLLIGIGKEFLYDKTPCPYDLTADIIGCIAGVYVNRWFQRLENNYYKKRRIYIKK